MENQPGVSLKSRPHFNDCVEWSEDGQLVICLNNNVHIMTPMLVGLASKKESYLHVGINFTPSPKEVKEDLIDEVRKIEPSFLSEEGFRIAKWSSAGLSPSQSCFLVVVTTKHRVLIFQSSAKESANSDWQLSTELTDGIEQNAIEHQGFPRINPHHTLYASWSNTMMPDPLASKLAFLALANKGGDVSIWSYTGTWEYKIAITAHNSFANLLAWTGWRKIDNNTSIAYIASTSTDGTVAISSVEVKFAVNEDKVMIVEDIKMKKLLSWFENDRSVPTYLGVEDDDDISGNGSRVVKIVVSKGANVSFLCLAVNEDNTLTEKGDWQSHILQNTGLGLSAGTWIDESVFRGYTIEGEAICLKFDAEGRLSENKEAEKQTNISLVQKYKQQWMEQQIKTDDDQIESVSDATPFLWGAGDSPNHVFTAIYFTIRPNIDIHVQTDSAEDADLGFILHQVRGKNVDAICESTIDCLRNPYFLFTSSIRGIVRELLYYLVNDNDSKPFEKWISTLYTHLKDRPAYSNGPILKSIYSEPSTIASRILVNAELELQNYSPPNFGDLFVPACKKARMTIDCNFISNLLYHALKMPQFSDFTEQDVTVLLLLSDDALTKGNPALVMQALDMYVKLQDNFPHLNLYEEIGHASTSNPEEKVPFVKRAREKCPVCDAKVNLLGGTSAAQCEEGHFWELCCMTKRVMYTPNTRKCVTCGAKSLQPPNDNSLTDSILKSCSKCIYCGSGLIKSR